MNIEKFSQKKIIEQVMDKPGKALGIHAIVEEGKTVVAKEPGDWYGVSSITQVVQSIFEKNKDRIYEEDSIFAVLDFLAFPESSIILEDLRHSIGQSIYSEVVRGYREGCHINDGYLGGCVGFSQMPNRKDSFVIVQEESEDIVKSLSNDAQPS